MQEKITQIREELADITSYLSSVTTVEEIGSNGLPNNTREVIFKSISRMLKLQKELVKLEAELGVNTELVVENLNQTDEYWQGMVDSGDYYRSHHNK